MESNDLRIFRIVAMERNITKAAKVLGYVQSNVTTRIQHLETELGTTLFYRQRGMMLTPAGEKLLPYAEKILHLFEEATNVVCDSSEPSGRLAIGANYLASYINLPKTFSQYHKKYPNVDLSLLTAGTEELVAKVIHFQLDGAFVKSSYFDEKNLVSELVFEENLVLITNPETKELERIFSQPFLVNAAGCPNRKLLVEFLQTKGIYDVRYMEFNSLESAINGVIAGLGVSFVPKSAIKQYETAGLLRSFSIPEKFSIIHTFFVRHKDIAVTGALSNFIEMLKDPIEKAPIRS